MRVVAVSAPRARWIAASASLVTLLLVLTACPPRQRTDGGYPITPADTVRPPFTSVDAASDAAVLQYAQQVPFDSMVELGDRQRLTVGTCPSCTLGPLVQLQVARGAAAIDTTQLVAGRFIGRFVTDQTYPVDSAYYRKFRLVAGRTTYMWVDRHGGDRRDQWRALFFTPGQPRGTRNLTFTRHRTFRWQMPFSRWVWSPVDEEAWVTCAAMGCCETSGGRSSESDVAR